MKKIGSILLVIVSIFLLVGCQGGQQQQQAKGAFLGGTQGVITQFEPLGVEEEGIFTIFETEAFPLEVTIHNKGEYQIQPRDVKIVLHGPAKSEIQGISAWELFNQNAIEKIGELVPEGGEETITFAQDAKFTTKIKGVIDRNWFANIEFHYKTQVIIPEVCLKEDLTDKRVCEVGGAKTFFVSGAPITVSAVEETTAGKGIVAVKLAVRNAGTGKVTTLTQDFGTRDTIAYSIDDPMWECKSGGRIGEARLINGAAEILCKLKDALPEKTLSTKQLSLTLDYRYRDIIQETLRIKESVN